jgi:predicted HD phosphohydrolase
MSASSFASIDELFDALADGVRFDDEEDVDQRAHALQCAALLRERAPEDLELQLAGLTHDVGSIVSPNHPETHAGFGGSLVAPLLGERVARLVRSHADAKRYLVTTDPAYGVLLSARSIETLAQQGATMSAAACATFAARPDAAAMIMLRRADDAAKDPNAIVPDLAEWLPRARVLAAVAEATPCG